MGMNIAASIPAARQLVEAVENAGGQVPRILHDLLDGVTLLTQQSAPTDPVRPVVEAAAAGELTAEKLEDLLSQASRDAAAADYRGQLRARCESAFLERFFKALVDGSADAILDSLREPFTEAATALAEATALVDVSVDPRQLADHGTPEQLTAFRSIKPAVQRLDAISGIARRFGPRSTDWAVIDLPNILGHRGLDDEALCCCADDLMAAGAVFRRRTADIRTVPWLRLTPRLNTIAESKERLRVWAEAEWETLNDQPGRGHFEDGQFVAETRVNPFAEASADA